MNIDAIIEWLILGAILLGSVFCLISSLGLIRLPDVYTRSHAATINVGLGLLFILFGAFVFFWYFRGVLSTRIFVVLIFLFLTVPVSGHAITRAAYRSGVPLSDISVKDELRDDLAKLEKEQDV